MRGRLNSTIWMLLGANCVALLAVLWLGYSAGAWARVPMLDAWGVSTEAGYRLLAGALVIILSLAGLFHVTVNRVATPVKELTEFSEKLVNGDYRARADVDSEDDFSVIAENLNRSTEKAAKLAAGQEALEALQGSVSEFLTLSNQIARGDLSLRATATSGALGSIMQAALTITIPK